ncbi:MAG: hypothetical protein ABIN69_15505 [Aestuariivirga sp.]
MGNFDRFATWVGRWLWWISAVVVIFIWLAASLPQQRTTQYQDASHSQTESENKTRFAVICEGADCKIKAENAGQDKYEPCKWSIVCAVDFWGLTLASKSAEDPVALYTLLLTLFTGGLTVSTILLWRAGERQLNVTQDAAIAAQKSAEISERTLIVTQRPIVVVGGFPWVWRPDTNPNRLGKFWYEINPNIENFGNTSTKDARINVTAELRDTVLPDDFDFPYQDVDGVTLIGSKTSIRARGLTVLDEDLLLIQQGKKHFYIWGTITYRDGFEGTPIHTTEFCSYISRVVGNPLDPRDPNNIKGTAVEIGFGI